MTLVECLDHVGCFVESESGEIFMIGAGSGEGQTGSPYRDCRVAADNFIGQNSLDGLSNEWFDRVAPSLAEAWREEASGGVGAIEVSKTGKNDYVLP
jgi:hypothetical protein